MVPLFGAVPGGPELLIILLLLLLLFGPVVVIAVAGMKYLDRKSNKVEDLEDRVQELEAELEREGVRSERGTDANTDDDGDANANAEDADANAAADTDDERQDS